MKYAFTDHQGSTRALMDGTGNVIARHDYLPFGEELWAGVGMRTAAQKFGAMDQTRMRYGLTEKDEATGLDHTWFRKHENNSGRWTSTDPLGGSIGNPQSLNRYSYVANDPLNLIDPSGLEKIAPCQWIDGVWVCFGPENTIHINTRESGLTEYLWVLNSRFSGFGGRGNIDPQNSDDLEGAKVVADAVENALEVLRNGCWTDDWNSDVQPGNRYFANIENPAKYTEGWKDAKSIHAKGVKESPRLAMFTIRANGKVSEIGTTLLGFNYVLKYYPGEGLAVTTNTESTRHALSAIGFATGLDPNVNVRYAQEFMQIAPRCK